VAAREAVETSLEPGERHDSLYTRITPVRTFEAIVDQIRESIATGKLKPGDRLPAQRDLASQFGVGRNGVLEAIRVLERAGLVEVRPGSTGGTFVRRVNGGRQFADQLRLLVQVDEISVWELAELRQALEGENAYWAAKRATPEAVDGLREVVRRCRESKGESIFPEDITFHKQVAVASQNRAAAIVFQGVLGSLEVVLERVPLSTREKGISDLQGICDAIAARDGELARERMSTHIADFASIVASTGKRPSERKQSR
jgi:GntR family transcriptional regulator, transcriptional repressor for pyruvate dehydrogenase complex